MKRQLINEDNFPGFPIERVPPVDLRNKKYGSSPDLEDIQIEGVNGIPHQLIDDETRKRGGLTDEELQ